MAVEDIRRRHQQLKGVINIDYSALPVLSRWRVHGGVAQICVLCKTINWSLYTRTELVKSSPKEACQE